MNYFSESTCEFVTESDTITDSCDEDCGNDKDDTCYDLETSSQWVCSDGNLGINSGCTDADSCSEDTCTFMDADYLCELYGACYGSCTVNDADFPASIMLEC